MKFFYDTEFLEDGRTIELISIGIVCEHGDDYYAVNSDMPVDRIKNHSWLMRNVWPHLPLRGHKSGLVSVGGGQHEVRLTEPGVLDTGDARVKPCWVIANEVRDFLLADGEPELWAYYGAYDHVALMQLWGPMIRKPKGLPMYTHDLQQEADRLGVSIEDYPGQEMGQHNALEDARWNRELFRALHPGEDTHG
jgi:hypothetical protein